MNYNAMQEKLDSFKRGLVFKNQYFSSAPNPVINSLGDIIYYCISQPTPTFYKGTSQMQNYGGARSAGDIYRLAKTYFDDVSYEKIHKTLDYLVSKYYISRSYCSTVRKDVHAKVSYDTNCNTKQYWNSILDSNSLNIK